MEVRMPVKTGSTVQESTDDILWYLCDSYEKLTGSRAALNSFLTMVFRKNPDMNRVLFELRSSIRKLKTRS